MLLALGLLAPVQALEVSASFEAAAQKVTDSGYAVFAYAADWDAYSKDICKKLLADDSIASALGDMVVLEAPIKEFPSEEEQKAESTRLGKLVLPKPSGHMSYPAVIMYDKSGRCCSVVCGEPMARADVPNIASGIRARREGMLRQQELLAQAAKAQGVEKAKLLGQAAEVRYMNRPDGILNQIKKADPTDLSGYVRRLSLNPWDMAGKLAKMNPVAAREEIEKLMADSAYSVEQQQIFCAYMLGTLRRSQGAGLDDQIRQYAVKMRDLDPASDLGRSADSVLRDWIKELGVIDGWTPDLLPGNDEYVEIAGPLPIRKSGTYTVTFEYTRGTDALLINGVRLYDGSTQVAEDIHDGFSGVKKTNNVYTLKVSSSVSKPVLKASFKLKGRLNSNGRIIVTRK